MNKIKIMLTDPDGVWESLSDAGLDPNELPENVERVTDKFIQYGEYVTIEIDIEEGTARVVQLND